MQARTALEALLASGNIENTLEQYIELARQYTDASRREQGVLQSSRYHHLIEQQREGTISQADFLTERARINRAALDMVSNIPLSWEVSDQVPAASPRIPAPSTISAPSPKSFMEKWGIALGIIASLVTIIGFSLKDVIAPKKETPTTETHKPTTDQPAAGTGDKPKPEPSVVQPPKQQERPAPKPSMPTAQNKEKDPTGTPVVPSPSSTQSTKPTAAANRFRSFAKAIVSEDMEMGFMDGGEKHAFRNLRTTKILCCYDDAQKFKGGKAYVKQNGRYFYIDPNGDEVK